MKQIYALLGDEPMRIVYIGCAENAKKRVANHWRQRNSSYRSPVKNWLSTLPEPPDFFVFEEVSDEIAYEAEQYYTEIIRDAGVELLNRKYGVKHSLETRIKIGVFFRGKKTGPFTEERRNNMSIAHTGKPLSNDHRDSMVKAMQSAEVRQKIGDGVRKSAVRKNKTKT